LKEVFTMDEQSNVATELPRYKCHKEVRALKIQAIDWTAPGDGAIITPEEPGYSSFQVAGPYCRKHHPQPGGYYVVYKDGYTSFSPAKAFEEGYTRLP
jgi:hypothetical protein